MPDIDIDLADRNILLDKVKHTRATIIKDKETKPHNTGVYFTDCPQIPNSNQCSIDYKEADSLGYFKIDLLNVNLYSLVKDRVVLKEMFDLRQKFMIEMKEANSSIYPEWPVDLTDKASQQVLRDTALKGVEEMFEALQHLKNWKPHKQTEVKEFNREEFLEEVVDAFNYFFSLLVLTGVDANELFDAYIKKDTIIHDRLRTGY